MGGYCRYPASTVHVESRYCVARIPGATCHVSRFCWSGGLDESFCEKGLCMCKWGYRVQETTDEKGESKYNCVPAGSELIAAVTRNATREEIAGLLEHQRHSDRIATWNVVIASIWVCGFFVLAVCATTFVMFGRKNKVSVHINEELLG